MDSIPFDVQKNLQAVWKRINRAAERYNRPLHSIQLLAVSKKKSSMLIRRAYEAGQKLFGENYLQEALVKLNELRGLKNIQFHFIGDIQANKVKLIAENFAWVHSISRKKIAKRLNDYRPLHLPPLYVCLQVNISRETSKHGVVQFEDLYSLAKFIVTTCPRLQLRGLMTIPALVETFEQQRQPYSDLKQMLDQLRERGIFLDTLSMGTSYDLEAAIAEGATIIRIGEAIFGVR